MQYVVNRFRIDYISTETERTLCTTMEYIKKTYTESRLQRVTYFIKSEEKNACYSLVFEQQLVESGTKFTDFYTGDVQICHFFQYIQ